MGTQPGPLAMRVSCCNPRPGLWGFPCSLSNEQDAFCSCFALTAVSKHCGRGIGEYHRISQVGTDPQGSPSPTPWYVSNGTRTEVTELNLLGALNRADPGLAPHLPPAGIRTRTGTQRP